ncbi:MAG: bifunctional chorismate mutase/prephenate dehydratase [Sakamotonia sp.]|jgi:chorismate mutase/prephenate dehydratase
MKTPDLKECREKLDGIDREIVRLFEERMAVCGQVAEYKIETGKAVYDGEREKQKIAAVREMAEGDQNKEAVEELFTQLMTMSRRYQYGLLCARKKTPPLGFQEVDGIRKKDVRVVFQGVEGAYSHAAVRMYFGEDADAYHVEKFEDTMKELGRGQADYAVLPIENSTAGFVITNYDLLSRYDNYIVGEIYVPVDHVLLGVPGASVSDVKTVYSHNQALMQCSEYLNSHRDWNQVSMLNTAAAAKKVMEEQDKTQAAVASRTAGELYGLAELKTSISNEKGNTTRFLVLSREPVYEKRASRVTITFEVPHVSGSLYRILGNFIFNGVNMRMIESRPIPDKPFEYRFFVDIEGNLGEAPVHNALAGIRAEASSMRILGNY